MDDPGGQWICSCESRHRQPSSPAAGSAHARDRGHSTYTQSHTLAGVTIPSRSCRPVLEPSLFPGIVTRSSCVWLQTEREWEPGARVCVPAVAQATRGQPGAAKTLGGRGQAPAQLPWAGVARGAPAARSMNTTRAQRQCGRGLLQSRVTAWVCSILWFGLHEGSGRPQGLGSETFADGQATPNSPGVHPGAGPGDPGSSGTNGTAGAGQAAESGRQPRGEGTGGKGRRRLRCEWCGVKAGPREGSTGCGTPRDKGGCPESRG